MRKVVRLNPAASVVVAREVIPLIGRPLNAPLISKVYIAYLNAAKESAVSSLIQHG